jgi:hypothetical protein
MVVFWMDKESRPAKCVFIITFVINITLILEVPLVVHKALLVGYIVLLQSLSGKWG